VENRVDLIDDLIGKVLAGEASDKDKAFVESWLRENEANQKYFDDVKTIFDRASSTTVQLQFDTDAAWKKVKDRLSKGRVTSEKEIRPLKSGGTTGAGHTGMRIAASLFIIVALGYGVYEAVRPRTQVQSVASGALTVQDTLPDGSTAFLNKKSEVRFEYNSREKTRKVKLKGEAFFEVKHQDEKPFIIETDEVLIKDLGTAFNVKAYPESNTVEVIVEEGEVQIYTLLDSGLNLLAGEKGVYDKTFKKFSKLVKIDTNSLSYKTKVFSFNNTDLGSVVDKLNEIYGSKIRLANDALRDCHLTVNFNDDKLETVIDVLAETLNLTVKRPDPLTEEIILEGKGCTN
jgi:transmembrane sensor